MIRASIVTATLLAGLSAASAADLGGVPLRGTIGDQSGSGRWDGSYFGSHIGYADANFDIEKLGRDTLNNVQSSGSIFAPVVGTPTLRQRDKAGVIYGAFTGYNIQMDNAIVGVELDYTRTNNLKASDGASGPVTATLADGNNYTLNVDTVTKSKLTDFATFRGRIGYAYGDLLPFLTVGGAVGRFETTTAASITGTNNTLATPVATTLADSRKNNFKFGLAAGAGFDFLLAPSVFLRAEYQYLAFSSAGKTDIHIARIGVATLF